MKPALIIVDMLKDTFLSYRDSYIVKQASGFVPAINGLSSFFRQSGFPVVFSCDSFMKEDFIFKGKMEPHSIRGTRGAEVIDELDRFPQDIISEKRRFSAFYKTDLDQTLRNYNVDTVAVTGIASHVCVLATILDAVSLDFNAILLKDLSTAYTSEIHDSIIKIYSKGPLYPLLRIMTSDELMLDLTSKAG